MAIAAAISTGAVRAVVTDRIPASRREPAAQLVSAGPSSRSDFGFQTSAGGGGHRFSRRFPAG